MGMIELDFISVTIGYVAGVLLTWSLTFTLYGCDDEEKRDTNTNSGIYGWNYPYDNNTYDRRIM